MAWFDKNNENGIIISSRVRLARNLKGYPFVTRMKKEEAVEICKRLKNELLERGGSLSNTLKFFDMGEMSREEKGLLAEKHLIAPQMANYGEGSGAFINDDENISILVNEEDHIRIQTILPGESIKEAFALADKIDDLIEEALPYAFDEKYGYLTLCPTNAGTGLRASVMMHLPALSKTGQMKSLTDTLAKLGMAVRGMYGEGSQPAGNIFQISNQLTLGMTEAEIIEKLSAVVSEIAEREKELLNHLLEKSKIEVYDEVKRSLGILKNAYKLPMEELRRLVSSVWMGQNLGIIKKTNLFGLLLHVSPYNLRKTSAENENVLRAEFTREFLKEV